MAALMHGWILIWMGVIASMAWAGDSALIWDAMEKRCEVLASATNAAVDFSVTNASNASVIIQGLRTSCGCTTVESDPFPWTLKPGEIKTLKIQSDIRGKNGVLRKSIILDTSAGVASLQMIILIASNKKDSRIRNMMAAFVDRQAVFKGDCAKSHVVPVLGKMGKDLFDSACVICHQSEQRATMVTDLRAKSLDRSREYWRTWIEDGRDGTLMPAFSQSKGGPLTASQIESLADYLGETFVRKGQKGEKGLESGL